MPAPEPMELPRPPATRTVDQVDYYHGHAISDPYRWLEDLDSPETRDWVESQNRATFAYLDSLEDRGRLRARLTKLVDYPRYSAPTVKRGRYFFFKNDGLQNQSVLYVQEGPEGVPRVLLDPNLLSADGTVALTVSEPNEDGSLLLYGVAASGSDWQEFRVRRVSDGVDLDDRLRWIKFSTGSWTRDGQGFFYSRYPEPAPGDALLAQNRDMKLYYHRLGTDQADDQLVYQRPDQPEWGFGAQVTHDGRYLTMTIWQGTNTRTRLYYTDLGDPNRPRIGAEVIPLLDQFDAAYGFVGNEGPIFYVQTDRDAPRSRLVAIDTRAADPTAWRELIPQAADVLQATAHIGGRFVVLYLHDAHSTVRVFDTQGRFDHELELPTLGSVAQLAGQPDQVEMFYGFTSFLYPTTIFRYDLDRKRRDVFKAPDVDFDPTQFRTEQVFVTSKDGTRVPMFLTYRRDLTRNGRNPTLLRGYGGFNVSESPYFSAAWIAWIERGGIHAVVNLRGGGEYGEEWHQAGMLDRKQNVFDDFAAAAVYLAREGYAGARHLAIQGGSNGGLLVAAAMIQRPELYAVVLPAVGVMDLLRFHQFTIGWAWVSEYGSADDPGMFPYLLGYSPLHTLESGTDYPAVLVTTADHDDRVVPSHSFKFVAALQAATTWRRPAYIRIETKAGHGAGKPIGKMIDEEVDLMAFALANMP